MKTRNLSKGLILLLFVLALSLPGTVISNPASEVEINGGNQFTNSRMVNLTFDTSLIPNFGSPTEMTIASELSALGESWIPYVSSMDYNLSLGVDGEYTVYVMFTSPSHESDVFQDSITLDTTPPSLLITNPVNNGSQINSSTLQVSWTAEDAGSGLDYNGVVDTNGNFINVENETTYTLTGFINGSYVFEVMAFDKAGNSRTVSVNFIVSIPELESQPEAPVASFVNSPSSPKVGETVSFDASGSSDPDGTIADYSWDFGDGNTATGKTVTYTYSSNGTYTVTLTVTDNDGLTDFATKTLTINISGTAPERNIWDEKWFLPVVVGSIVAGTAISVAVFYRSRRAPRTPGEIPRSYEIDHDLKINKSGFPLELLVGDFVILVENYTNPVVWRPIGGITTGVTGSGWVNFSCGEIPKLSIVPSAIDSSIKIKDTLKVVTSVENPSAEITLDDARMINPNIKIGENLEVDMSLAASDFRNVVKSNKGLAHYLASKKGDVLVEFENVTVQEVDPAKRIGRIIEGKAVYPASFKFPDIIKLHVNNFIFIIDSLTLKPDEAIAHIELQLPKNIASADSCQPATLDIGEATITPDCQFYADKTNEEFGPWIIGDTGMIAEGRGYVADFSSSLSPPSETASWKGVLLISGEASGEKISPKNSNTGFITGKYSFNKATISSTGLKADFKLEEKHLFQTYHPLNYIISMENGNLAISESRIVSGTIGNGAIEFPPNAICRETLGKVSKATFSSLIIKENMDITGEIDFADSRNAWGELTRKGKEVIAWSVRMRKGYVYLPSRPALTFSPDTASGFLSLSIPSQGNDALDYLEANEVTGVTLSSIGGQLEYVRIHSTDRPNGTKNPIELRYLDGWLRIGSHGIDGELSYKELGGNQELGDITREKYVGKTPFNSTLAPANNGGCLLGQFINSAVFDSELDGSIDLAYPCGFALEFRDLEITSTANLVGGGIFLPINGVEFDHWKVDLRTDTSTQAGVMSVRTGRLIFTDAKIWEEIHFERGFGLIWGEIFANGNVGELFFDYNNYGQRFDKLPYCPHHITLSEYKGNKNEEAYLATCGNISINFFGLCFANIKDAKYLNHSNAPYYNRLVTVPKELKQYNWPKTDLTMHGEWNDSLAIFDFPDEIMGYNNEIQNGFKGKNGKSEVNFIHSDTLSSDITIRENDVDIRFAVEEAHNLEFAALPRVGSLVGLKGCVRITGPTLKRFAIHAFMETAVTQDFGLLSAKAAGSVEVLLSVTPTSCTFMASGELLAAITGASVEISGYIHLTVDFENHVIEGDLLGRVDCSSVVGGLEGDGQLTWFIDKNTQYLQGRVSMKICSWVGSGGIEGGIFLGINCPEEKAWVLKTSGNENFGISDKLLAKHITGIYGYGQVSASLGLGFIDGGFSLYAGMGALLDGPLPELIGSFGLYIHGEILWGVVSASAWGKFDVKGTLLVPYFEGKIGLEGCVLWVICASVELTAGLNINDGFYLEM